MTNEGEKREDTGTRRDGRAAGARWKLGPAFDLELEERGTAWTDTREPDEGSRGGASDCRGNPVRPFWVTYRTDEGEETTYLRILKVEGDSMAPEIREGDRIVGKVLWVVKRV